MWTFQDLGAGRRQKLYLGFLKKRKEKGRK